MGTKLNKETYKKLIKEDMESVEKYFPEHSLEKKHILEVLRSSIECYYPSIGKQPSSVLQANELSPLVSVSFSAEEKAKVHKYHKQTLAKVNKLYKYLYDRSVCATELADQQQEVFAYLELSDDVKEAYRKFENVICALANER